MSRGRRRSGGMRRKNYKPRRKQFGYKKKGVAQPVQFFKRTFYRENFVSIPSGGIAPQFASINFQLANVPNVGEFTALYDQYCIKGVKVKLIPRVNSAESTTPLRNMYSVLDYDDSTTPTSRDQLLQYQNMKSTPMTKVHTRYLKPAVAQQLFATGVLSGYSSRKNVWIDCTYDNVEHYGIKLCWDQLTAASTGISYDILTTFYLAFKNVR